MIWSVIVLAVGLVVTLIGMVIVFWTNPPVIKLPTIEQRAKDQAEFVQAYEQGKLKTPLITETEWSWLGVRLLVFGTFLQLVGTVWQVVRLACRK